MNLFSKSNKNYFQMFGTFSVAACNAEPCGVGGQCEPVVNSFVCRCYDGYSGDHCENGIKVFISVQSKT